MKKLEGFLKRVFAVRVQDRELELFWERELTVPNRHRSVEGGRVHFAGLN